MAKIENLSKTKRVEFKEIPNSITFRTKDYEIKNAIKFISEYLQVYSFSEVVRQAILEYFKSIKVRKEKQEELQKLADLYDLKVVPKYIRR